jgi:hypothetical protein
MGELKATVVVMVLDRAGGDDIVLEKASSCEEEASDGMSTDVVFVNVGGCAVEANGGGGTTVTSAAVALATINDGGETVGRSTLEVPGGSVVMAVEEIRVGL